MTTTLIAGQTLYGGYDAALVLVDQNGFQFLKKVGGSGNDAFADGPSGGLYYNESTHSVLLTTVSTSTDYDLLGKNYGIVDLWLYGGELDVNVGIEKQPLNSIGLNVFPNPCSDKITVMINNNASIENEISIYSLQGMLLYQTNSTNKNPTLDVSLLAAGTYILVVKNVELQQTVLINVY